MFENIPILSVYAPLRLRAAEGLIEWGCYKWGLYYEGVAEGRGGVNRKVGFIRKGDLLEEIRYITAVTSRAVNP